MKRLKVSSLRDLFLDAGAFLAGSFLYALSVNSFTAPSNIAPGGLTGIATLLHYLFSLPIGTMILVMNLPLFLLSAKVFGMKFLAKTLIATALVSVMIDVTVLFLPVYHGDSLLAAIYGGVLSGCGLSLIFLRGGTTGGTDIGARLIHRVLPHFPIGRIILLLDIVVIVSAALVYRSINAALYAVIAIFCSTTLIDKALYGAGMGKVLYVVSDQSETLSREIMNVIRRGVTLLDAEGAYTGEQKKMIFCVVRRHEVGRVRRLILDTDPHAFIIIGDAAQVLGTGFNRPDDITI